MDNKIKILYFVDRLLLGGIQKLLYEWAIRLDKSKFQVDFLVLDDGNEYELEKKLKIQGFNVYKLKKVWINTPFDYIKYCISLNEFFKQNNDYKVLHMNSTSKNYIVLKYAKKYGINIRISHSHALGFQTNSPIKKAVGDILKSRLIKYSTDFFACSNLAGEWLFGKKIVNSERFQVIHNAIDFDKFKYDEKIRIDKRKELNIKDSTVVFGHVGRFSKVKNHIFLIDIFCDYHKKNSESQLILIGDGQEFESVKKYIQEMNLENYIQLIGFTDSVNEYYQAMDVFVMPSIYEGLGMSLIEAQASGMPCFASKDVVPDEAKILENFSFISLKKDSSEWSKIISETNLNRIKISDQFKNKEYLIDDIVKKLEKIYSK